MLQEIDIAKYYQEYSHIPLIDVRSPGEFEKGHIPGAYSIPLFSNDERAAVGTVYVQKSREKAVELGYTYVNPKLDDFIIQSEAVAPNSEVIVHCWRGGMRSRSFAQHLHDNGFQKVYIITGGYKAFRNHALDFFAQPFNLRILGGYTGSGKTYILKEIKAKGHQVIDLEKLANHKGSAFGAINEAPQPTVEQFENNLFETWRFLDITKPIWVEDESHNIGGAKIPMNLFNQMRTQKVLFIEIPREERAKHLVSEYSNCDKSMLAEGIKKISKRLGGVVTQQTNEHLVNNNFYEVALLSLHYYDKAYLKGVRIRGIEKAIYLQLEDTNPQKNADTILKFIEEYERNKAYAI